MTDDRELRVIALQHAVALEPFDEDGSPADCDRVIASAERLYGFLKGEATTPTPIRRIV